MARTRRHSAATTPEGRYEASRIQDARRRGYTNKQIATAFGINERTVRKIVSGDTPGTRIFKERVETRQPRSSPNVFRADIEVADGEVRTINVRLPDYTNAKGQKVAPTAFDIFRYPDLDIVAMGEAKRMQQRYQFSEAYASKVIGLRPAARYKKIPFTIEGTMRQ